MFEASTATKKRRRPNPPNRHFSESKREFDSRSRHQRISSNIGCNTNLRSPGLGWVIDAFRGWPGKTGLLDAGLVVGCSLEVERRTAETHEYSRAERDCAPRVRVDPGGEFVSPFTVPYHGFLRVIRRPIGLLSFRKNPADRAAPTFQ